MGTSSGAYQLNHECARFYQIACNNIYKLNQHQTLYKI